jgi:protease IV
MSLHGCSMNHLLRLICALSLSLPAIAWSQTSPSVGIPVPDGSIATQTDSASLEVNPAGLGFVEGSEFSYAFFLPTADYRGVVPSGHSLSLALGGPGSGFGFGVQWMDNPLLGGRRAVFRKYTLGGALSSRFFSFGAALNFFGSRYDERLNALRTADLGLQWRPNRFLGIGLMTRDFTPAFLDEDQALQPRVGLGLALRLFEGRLVFDTEVHSVRRADTLEIRPRLAGEPLRGLRLFGTGMISIPAPGSVQTPGFDGLSFGLELSMGTFGLQSAAHVPEEIQGNGLKASGLAYRVWGGTPQKRPLFSLKDRWVRVNIDSNIAEQASSGFFQETTRSFLNLINDLNAITEDPAIGGVILDVQSGHLGYSQIWELHQAMDALHGAGKESIALLRNPTTRSIYAASAAESIWMSPVTPYSPTGLLAEFTSFAGLLDRFGVEAEFVRIGDYKSAPEAYVMSGPSDEALEQTSEFLDALFDELTTRIASRRGIAHDEFLEILDVSPIFPADALERGLVDAIVYPDEIEAELERRLDRTIGLERTYERHEIADARWGGRPEIAVVYVDGMIVTGSSGQGPFGGGGITGAETFTQTLRALREDNTVKAVVVRIDSPGGSALASDLIYRELRYLATEKPVIASMSNIAASGGYYVAAGADEIFATPLTLTGSIGIFAGKFNIQELADRMGIATYREGRGPAGGTYSIWRPFTQEELQFVARTIDYLYQLFLQQIERTRPLTVDEIDGVARGRIWAGAAAREAGLVDQVGGFADALRRAEELAGLEHGQAIYVDRTGMGGLQMSPGMATRVNGALRRLSLDRRGPISHADGELPRALRELEPALLWPLYFDSGEALALPPYLITLR